MASSRVGDSQAAGSCVCWLSARQCQRPPICTLHAAACWRPSAPTTNPRTQPASQPARQPARGQPARQPGSQAARQPGRQPPTRLCVCGDRPVAGKGAEVVDADLVVQLQYRQAVQGIRRYRDRQYRNALLAGYNDVGCGALCAEHAAIATLSGRGLTAALRSCPPSPSHPTRPSPACCARCAGATRQSPPPRAPSTRTAGCPTAAPSH